MSRLNIQKTAESILAAATNASIAAGGFQGMCNALSGARLPAEDLTELKQTGHLLVEAAPEAIRALRECADAIERLSNLIWAMVDDTAGPINAK